MTDYRAPSGSARPATGSTDASPGLTNSERASPPPAPRRHRRWLAWTLGSFGALLLLIVVAGSAAWWWIGTNDSLAIALARVERYLPAGQTLATREVSGSLRQGGRIGWLRWDSPGLTVEATEIEIGWRLAPLLHRSVQLAPVRIRLLTLESKPQPPSQPSAPLEQLALPVNIDVPFEVGTIRWLGATPIDVTALKGRYQYVDDHHQLAVDGVDVADGHYRAKIALRGPAPMALDAKLDGEVRIPVPDRPEPLPVVASVTAQGTLATAAARLKLVGRIAPPVAPESAVAGDAASMRAAIDADIAPWAKQPLMAARAEFASIDLKALVPQAPATRLSGTLVAGPSDSTEASRAGSAAPPEATQPANTIDPQAAWTAEVQITNDLPGPWDSARLPVDSLVARALFRNEIWTVPEATVFVGGGRIDAKGSWGPPVAEPDAASGQPPAPASSTKSSSATAPWQAQVALSNLRPAAIYSTLDSSPLQGKAEADLRDGVVGFDVQIRGAGGTKSAVPTRRTPSPGSLRLRSVDAKGRWDGNVLTVPALKIEAADASVQGNIEARIKEQSGFGKLAVALPGTSLQINGAIAPIRGQGTLAVKVQDAARTVEWVAQLPGMSTATAGVAVDGALALDGSWDGGWQVAQSQIAALTAAAATIPARTERRTPAADFSVKAALRISALSVRLPTQIDAQPAQAPVAIQVKNLQADIAGSLAQANLKLKGDVTSGSTRVALDTEISGGIDGQHNARIALAKLGVRVQNPPQPGPWTLTLDKPLNATMQLPNTSNPSRPLRVEISAATASVEGPVAGTVRVEWDEARYVRIGEGATAQHQLRSRGALRGLPMAWANAFSPDSAASMANAGVQGDLVFDGAWDIDAVDALKAEVSLARRSGDLRVRGASDTSAITKVVSTGTGAPSERSITTAANEGGTIAAGVRDAKVTLTAAATSLRADIVWRSERAGNATASAATQLTRSDSGWAWAENAPILGKVDARLPSIGAWSTFAPPGWRVDGSFTADAVLSGTRMAPQWQGAIQGDDMAIRSAVDGVELRNGKFRASLTGNRIVLREFRIEGGSGTSARIGGLSGSRTTARTAAIGSNGGNLTASGEASWNASTSGSGLRMDLTAQLQSLRVLSRTDREVELSGKTDVSMRDGQITVRGALKTDRAVIVLPEGSAPTLGSDVVVRSAVRDRDALAAATIQGTKAAKAETAKPPDVLVNFNLGEDFAVQGKGITTRLTGALEIRSNAGLGTVPSVTGEIRTAQGKYRAYGQQLDVSTGLARFNGPYDNPSLDIVAIRPNIPVKAGVQVTGTAQAPQVRLFSEPELPDAEKLSWVILGRSTANGGAEAALLQQAALALLAGGGTGSSGNIASKLGLDEIGFRGPGSGAAKGGEEDSPAITFGKRLSEDFYLTYERSLSGTLGTLFIFYDLTETLTLRGQTGKKSGLDLIYTLPFD